MQNFSHLLLAIATSLSLPTAVATAEGPVREGALIAEIVAAKTSIAPGETIDLALRLAHDKGWHSYWKSPGIVGLGTAIEWKLPAGFTTAPIRWPQPETVKMGPYTAYGYHDEVFLVVPLTAPADAEPGTVLRLSARATWMCCAKTCHPASADLSLTLAISANPGKASLWQKPIAAARSTFAKTNTLWTATALLEKETITLRLQPVEGTSPTPPKRPYFFCHDGLIHSDVEQRPTRTDDGTLTFTLSTSEFGPKNPTHLRGILYTRSGKPDGSGAQPIELKVPLTQHPL